jgi:hypothetical protein
MFSRLRSNYANVTATLALVLALGGTAYAAATITGGDVVDKSLTGADIKNNSLEGVDIDGVRGQDVENSSLKGGDILDQSIRSDDLHPSALPPAGPQGPKGEDASNMWAVVTEGGGLSRGESVASTSRSNNGVYVVVFGREVTGCAFVGNIGDPAGGSPGSGELTVSRSGTHGVLVETRNSGGSSRDESFHLAVLC